MSKRTVAITGAGKPTLSSNFSKIAEHPELSVKVQGNASKSFQECLDEETEKIQLARSTFSEVLDYLETAFCGAKMINDLETMTRIARAITALKAPTNVDIFNQDFVDKYVTK